VTVYERLVGLAPASADAAIRLGIALARSGRTAEAIARLEQAVVDHPLAPTERALALGWAADARLRLEDAEGARAVFEVALESAPEDVDLRDGLGRALVQLDLAEAALAEFESAAQRAEASHSCHGNRAATLWALDRKEEGMRRMAEAALGRPTDPVIAANLGRMALSMDRPSEAVEAVRRASAAHEGDEELDSVAKALDEALEAAPAAPA
jgi:Flp pilus assembly protein TadD